MSTRGKCSLRNPTRPDRPIGFGRPESDPTLHSQHREPESGFKLFELLEDKNPIEFEFTKKRLGGSDPATPSGQASEASVARPNVKNHYDHRHQHPREPQIRVFQRIDFFELCQLLLDSLVNGFILIHAEGDAIEGELCSCKKDVLSDGPVAYHESPRKQRVF
ncbi:hypothetical protein PRIPAC_78658 [Pristionchus pacificus]|uniref:Uncharacterized protein n=1 Tax=Pristionchus pacificus TaxID=54126 RepID=A0A2A6CQ97_PRIPA|nr:hypothetical protein PRIPAC_78658 [Pristionchus pacificus]|eukprot:PDM80258.1 hypothetical protein PRIPAC_32837 [Pristionchus pacificus]